MTLLIKNVNIVGSEEKFPRETDVFVNGDKISAIGNLSSKSADVVVDGNGAYLSPGFIDLNTDSDHFLSIFDDRAQEDFIAQGVTTILGGMCGASLAPILYGGLESIRKWTDIRMNVNWHRVEEFLALLEKKPLAVNFATLAGHSTIRRELANDCIRDLTKNELAVFGETLERAMREGAMGLSTGLSYVHCRETPYSELKFLAKIVSAHKGLYATHLKNIGTDVDESVAEAIRLAKETGVNTLISHLVPIIGAEKDYEAAIEMIESLPKNSNFHFDIYPHHTTARALYTFLPAWAQNGGQEMMVHNIEDEWLRPKIFRELPDVNPDDFIAANVPCDPTLSGKSLKDLGELYGIKKPKEVLLKLMRVTALSAIVLYKEVNYDLLKKVLKSKRALIASNAASFKKEDPRKMFKSKGSFNTFTTFLSLTQKENLMSLEEAVQKITLEPARKLHLENRGVIKEGFIADLAAFKGDEVKLTVVGGNVVYRDGAFQGWFPGRILRHKT
ncbi:hypothetical protein C4571_00040 [Candidatus Parcubacteria bacterium]|nr:MAG: hypothetical protein C4571_00040 [Candidatus Parcubacteria bacterium]